MLVLSRKLNEEIRIGFDGEITVKVLEIRGDKVRLGITAPDNVPIHRQEVWARINPAQAATEEPELTSAQE